MAENKFIQKLKGKQSAKSLIEIEKAGSVASFGSMPIGSSDSQRVYADVRDNAVVIANSAINWKIQNGSLVIADVTGAGQDYSGNVPVSGISTQQGNNLWLDAQYTVPADGMLFTANTKWVLKLCGDNLINSNGSAIDFTIVLKLGATNIITKAFTIAEQANFFNKELVIDFEETNSSAIKLSQGDTITLQLLSGTATASARIYTGMTVLSCLQRKITGDLVDIKGGSIEDLEAEVSQLSEDLDDLEEYVDETFVKKDGSSIMTGPLKFRAGSFEGAIAGGLGDGISVYKLKADGSIDSEVASLTNTNGFVPGTNNAMNIGRNNLKWKDLYVARVITSVLNNGADINVPTTGGTLGLNDFSNITDSAKNIANWSSNVSNCITEIPQDIKLELNNGTLKLKAGSKVYIPNGAGVYDVVTLTADKTQYITGSGEKALVYYSASTDSVITRLVNRSVSGDTRSITQTYMAWYDTANNVINEYYDDASTPRTTMSFPVALVTLDTSGIKSIDQVFNGFGYIGSTTFALPGVSVLAPDGRNQDGTLKTYAYTVPSVIRRTDTTNGTYFLTINCNNGNFGVGQYVYDETTNYNYVNNAVSDKSCIVASATTTSGKMSNLSVKTPFHAVDYSDFTSKANIDLDNLSATGKANISARGTYNTGATYTAGTVGAAIQGKADKATTLAGYGITDGANTDLSNLTATGANIANWSSNVSNCITEIPQDINLTLSNGTLTLKAGSKVYKPDGTSITIASDISINTAPSGTTMVCVHSNGSALYTQYPTNIVSGATDSKAGETYHWWFDTTNNVINRYTTDGTTPSQTLTFPIAIITSPSGTISSIDQVFNGAGYVGHHAFTLPNVKALLAQGLNTDGTLKSLERKPGQVYVVEMSTGLYGGYGRTISIIAGNPVNNAASYVEIKDRSEAVSQAWVRQYVSSENIIIARTSDNGPFVEFNAGAYPPQTPFIFYNYNGTNVTKFDIVQPMRAVNYNDTGFISHQTTPSNRQTSLTLGASGSTYTMPSDGYICIRKETDNTNQYIDIRGRTRISSTNSIAGEAISLTLRVSKGEVIQVDYNAAGDTSFFKFVYDIGAK